MRGDLIEAQIVLPHPPRRVWEVLADPELYPRFIKGVTWCRHLGGGRRKGACYEVRLAADDDRVMTAVWEVRDFRPGQRLALAGGGRDGYRASVNLEGSERGTALHLLLSLPDGSSDALSAGSVRKRLQAAGRILDDHLTGKSAVRGGNGDGGASLLATTGTLVQAGVLRPDRPDRTVKQLRALQKWGATLAGGYRGAAVRDPAATAVRDERGSLSFAAVDDRSTRLAHALARWGVGAGSTVATMCRNHAGYLETLLACGKLGAHVAMLNTGLSAEQVADVLDSHQPSAVLADDEFVGRIAGVPGDCPLISTWQEPGTAGADAWLDDLIDATAAAPIRPPRQPGRVLRPIGCYTAVFTAPEETDTNGWFLMHNSPGGRVASARPGRLPGEIKAGLSFRSAPISYDRHDTAQQRDIVARKFAAAGWEVPRLLDAMRTATDFFFDSMNQVHVENWSRGRIVLLGDAGYCPTPLSGLGTSLALVGAYVLAGELGLAAGDHQAAFSRYEQIMRPYVTSGQRLPPGGARGYAPSSSLEIKLRTASMRWMTRWPMRKLLAAQFSKAGDIDLPDYGRLAPREAPGALERA